MKRKIIKWTLGLPLLVVMALAFLFAYACEYCTTNETWAKQMAIDEFWRPIFK